MRGLFFLSTRGSGSALKRFRKRLKRGSIAGFEEFPHAYRFRIRSKAHAGDANMRPVISQVCERYDRPSGLPGFLERE